MNFLFVDLASSQPHLASGRIRMLAVTSEQLSAMVPDLPTIAEVAQLPGFDLSAWVGVVGQAGMPASVVERLSRQINAMLARKDVVDKLVGLGAEVAPAPAKELDVYMKSQLEVWGRKVKDIGIQPE